MQPSFASSVLDNLETPEDMQLQKKNFDIETKLSALHGLRRRRRRQFHLAVLNLQIASRNLDVPHIDSIFLLLLFWISELKPRAGWPPRSALP